MATVPIKVNGDSPVPQVDFLIVGGGPAGGSLTCFLGYHGLKGMIVNSSSSTADTPRAHVINMAAFECLRDVGLERECLPQASTHESMIHTRWVHSMMGREYARLYSWGNDPKRQGDYDAASPCKHLDLPQNLLEPILTRYATQHGFQCRFNTAFVSFQDDQAKEYVEVTVKDNVSLTTYKIRCKYLFGADGARSRIVKQLEFPLDAREGQGVAINVLVKADLMHLMSNRKGNLHWVLQPDVEHPEFAWIGIVRMVRMWDEWLIIMFPTPNCDPNLVPTRENYLQRVKEFIGDDSIPVEILSVSKWTVNEIVSTQYQKDRVFCLGDAVHRHPPMNGLGSNTCIQDAFNLAWKIAYVEKGLAGKSLLDTYHIERQPVGAGIVERANTALRIHKLVWEALGLLGEDVEDRKRQFAELSEDSPKGRARRANFQAAVEATGSEFHGLGVEMNQRYNSRAVFQDGQGEWPPLPDDPVRTHLRTTYPGARLPHTWLNTSVPSKQFSTIDLAGHGHFCLLTGVGGQAWKESAQRLSTELGVKINSYSIGFGQDYEDVYFDWEKIRGVSENGCVLVRPDRFVAWRSESLPADSYAALHKVMTKILHL